MSSYQSLKEFCDLNHRQDLLLQWHTQKNGLCTPENVAAGSSKKVWWKDEYGHEWTQTLYNRTRLSRGCPICANRKILPGFNDLATTHPNLVAQWDPEKNEELTPAQVSASSKRKAWWSCENGHTWKAAIYSRVEGAGCPVCANRKIIAGINDLATTHSAIAAEWHPTKNMDLTPQKISYGYDKKVWWRCARGHEWEASPITRVKMGAGCPVCANYVVNSGYNDLETMFPQIAAEWHPTKNGQLTPRQVVFGSNRAVWWQCKLGHEWCATIVGRTRATNACPYCSNKKVLAGFNDLLTLKPKIAAQWHPTLNGALTPEMVTPGSSRKVWWICQEAHVWRTTVWNRAMRPRPTGCPVCAGNVPKTKRPLYTARFMNRNISTIPVDRGTDGTEM